MTQICIRNFPDYDPSDYPDWAAAEIEQVWDAPLDPDLLLVGGADRHGWARLCLDPSAPADRLIGVYRDLATWYEGRWHLPATITHSLSEILKTHYVSHFAPGEGLYLYPLANVPPPVPYLVARPIDANGFRTPPAQK